MIESWQETSNPAAFATLSTPSAAKSFQQKIASSRRAYQIAGTCVPSNGRHRSHFLRMQSDRPGTYKIAYLREPPGGAPDRLRREGSSRHLLELRSHFWL
jgi:hypothetical protein